MTNSELRKLISKYIDPNVKKDLILHGNLLYQIPVSDFLKGFCFEQSGYDKEGFYLWCFIQPLYIPSENLVLTYGKRLSINKVEWWGIDKDDEIKTKDTFENINSILKAEGLPYIEELGNRENFYTFCKEHKKTNVRIWEALVYTGFFNKIIEAGKEAEMFINHLKESDTSIPWLRELAENLRILLSKSEAERSETFVKNKEFTINNLHLK
jgi:hypothetical protein